MQQSMMGEGILQVLFIFLLGLLAWEGQAPKDSGANGIW